MRYHIAFIVFSYQSCLCQTQQMPGNCFNITFQFYSYIVYSDSIISRDQKKNLNSSVICNTFQVVFQLPE